MKEITLYNDKSVFLKFKKCQKYYTIESFDDAGKLIGYCCFDIEKLFEKIEKSNQKKYIYLDRSNENEYKIKNNLLFYQNKDGQEEIYHLNHAKCKMKCIEIKSAEFFKTGLGSAMFKEMENYAKQEQCCQIYARYQPYGEFANGTSSFYIKNGFSIEKDPYDKCYFATKDLTYKNFENDIERKL